MNIGSVFSGIGGLELGLERAGLGHVIWQIEIDPFCRAVLAKHWPNATRFEDVRTTGTLPGVDVLVGGFPCQPVSCAGKRRGHKDERWLWPEMFRLVRELRPRWVVAENVPGIRTLGADRVIENLESEGYAVWPLVVGADDVGAPHRRKRVFFVAHRESRGFGERGGAPDSRKSGDPDGSRETMAHGDGRGRERERRPQPGRLERPSGNEPHRCDVPLEHAALPGLEGLREGLHRPTGCLDDTNLPGSGDAGQADPRLGLNSSRGPDRRTAWPASPGQPQHDWEPPRTIARSQPWFCPCVDGLPPALAVPYRRDALRALGNSVVPQVAEAIGRAILNIESTQKTSSPARQRRA